MGAWIIVVLLSAQAPAVAITLDDGPHVGATPRMTAPQRNAALLQALAKHHVRAGLFVTVNNGANTKEGVALLRAWGAAGHLIGNHTVTHPDLNAESTTLQAYQDEVMACDAVIRTVPGYQRLFRFPFLREGKTPAKRDGMRAFLAQQGYRNAYVTLDTSDWRLDQHLGDQLALHPALDLAPYRTAYLNHVWQRAQAYQELSQRLLKRQIPQVMLLHHNLLNALFLEDVIAMFQRQGWTLVDPQKAYEDPVYQLQPDRAAPGQSLLLSLARSRGMDLAPYARLMDDADEDIALLKRAGH